MCYTAFPFSVFSPAQHWRRHSLLNHSQVWFNDSNHNGRLPSRGCSPTLAPTKRRNQKHALSCRSQSEQRRLGEDLTNPTQRLASKNDRDFYTWTAEDWNQILVKTPTAEADLDKEHAAYNWNETSFDLWQEWRISSASTSSHRSGQGHAAS